MRYLGQVAKQFKDKEYQHVKTLLEKEVLLRGAKHVINECIRECPVVYTSSVIAHLFNCLVAPTPMREKMEKDQIKFVDTTL